jgi:YegS/Rv2252/BmrU family lipid kinase
MKVEEPPVHPPATERRKAAIFLNASSGFNDKQHAPELLEGLFREAGWEPAIEMCQKGMRIDQLAEAAVQAGAERVLAGGGDGTIRAVASALAGKAASLGVLPVGTLNHFARDLNIPIDLEQAAHIALNGVPRQVDVAAVNGHVFINNAVIGLYPWYRQIRDDAEQRGSPKVAAILRGIFRVLRVNPYMNVSLEVDGRRVTRRTPYILIANNRHAMEGYRLGTREALDSGKLYVYLMRQLTRFDYLRLVLSLVFGRFRTDQDFEVLETTRLTVATPRRRHVNVSLDGEIVRLENPLEFESRPGALSVIAPRPEPSMVPES